MAKTPRAAPVLLALLSLLVACISGARAPNVAPNGTLAPGDEGQVGASEGPFAVVFASPRGQIDEPSEVTIVFNRPMRALDLAGEEAKSPVSMSPEAKGRWSWLGTTALAFVPEDHLARATTYSVEVPASTRALDGSTLEKPFRFKFSTARPALVRADTEGAHAQLEPGAKFALRFNQPVSEGEVKRVVSFKVGERAFPFDLKRTDPKNLALLELVPKQRLPLDSPIVLEASADLHGSEGQLPAGKEQSFAFSTYGPLKVSETMCSTETPNGRCAPDQGVTIHFTNAVKFADIKKALRIDPPVKIRWPGWYGEEAREAAVDVIGRFTPGRSYTFSVAGGLADEHGQRLGAAWSKRIDFDDLWPVAEIGLTGALFEPNARRSIPIASINVGGMELATARLDEVTVLKLADERRGSSHFGLEDIRRLAGSSVKTVRPGAAKNTVATQNVDPGDVLGGKDKRGPLALAVSFTRKPGTRWAQQAELLRIAQVTDLGISAKVSRHGSLVWVTHLSTGAPVANASVWIQRTNEPKSPVTTDAAGFAFVPETAFKPGTRGEETAVVFARTSDDWTYKNVSDAVNGYRFGVSIDLSDGRPFGMAFTDRGIYRPGDTVHVKAIFRQEAHPGTATPSGRPVSVSVEGPDGEPIAKPTVTLSRFGTASFDVKVPDTGRLGSYAIHASVEGSPRESPDVSGDFEVAEYRAAEFKVGVEPSKPAYVRGDSGSWTARGDFLFGAPMATSDARITVTRTESGFTPPGFEAFAVDDHAFAAGQVEKSPHATELQNASTKLDAKGEATISTSLAMPGQSGAELVTCEAEVTDISRQVISSSSSQIVHPGEFYVGLKAGDEVFVKSGDPVKVEVVAADPKGAKVTGVPVQLELLKRTWSVAKQAVGGGFRDVMRAKDQHMGACAVTTTGGLASCSMTTAGAGYYLVHATATDKRKNPIAASYGVYVTGDGETSWGDNDKSMVELVADRKSYEVGQTARVLVKNPWKTAEALVTVERAGVYTQRRMTLTGAMPTIEVPITESLRPNAFVSVLMVKGRSKALPGKLGAPDVGAPSFRLGYAPLPIDPEARRLEVKVKTNKEGYRPGENIDVDVDVKDKKGQAPRAELTLYAADEGVLSLIGYKTPDPIPVFGAARSLQVETIESRDAMARVMNPFSDLGLDKGFDGGGGGLEPGVRKDFRASAYFSPALVLDDKGHVHASFKLPDSLTTYRVMAVVTAEDDRFGFGEARAVTSRPLMARPALPRFVRAGDAFDASVVVTSKGLARSYVDVEVAVEGLDLKGEPRQRVTVEQNASIEVRFPMAAPRAGKAKIKFTAKGGGSADAVEVTREVTPPMISEAVALYGETTKASAEKLGDLSAMRDDVGGLEVSLASTALVGLGGGVEQLVEYPYGCTEQLTSRLVPLLPLRQLAADFKLKQPADTDRVVKKAVVDILSHQRSDGGFGLWKESPESSPWITAYALWGLAEARGHGVEVPKSSLASATGYLKGQLAAMERRGGFDAEAPFILDVLAQLGEPDPARVTRSFEKRDELPLFSKALLLHAAVLSKSDGKMRDELARDVESHLRIDANEARAVENDGDKYALLLDSNTRTSAFALRGLLADKPNHALASRLARGILKDRRGGTWRTTQETAWALLALSDYRKAQEKVTPDFDAHVFFGESQIFEAPFKGRGVEQPHTFLPAKNLAGAKGVPLSFSVDGSGKLFYEARLKYAKKVMPKTPLERGFFVRKTLRRVKPEDLEAALGQTANTTTSRFNGGDLVLGEIVVITPSPRNFVVIDDPLPAGFEAIDARLATSSSKLDVDAQQDEEPDVDEDADADAVAKGGTFRASRFLREVRDDRVLFFVDHLSAGMFRYRYLARATALGSFSLPPTKAEEMYTPEVFGRSGGDTIRIDPK